MIYCYAYYKTTNQALACIIKPDRLLCNNNYFRCEIPVYLVYCSKKERYLHNK